MVKIRVDNQIIKANYNILFSEGKVFIDDEPFDIVFPGKFDIELIEGVMKKTEDDDILYESE